MPLELDTFDCRVDLPDWRIHLASLAANTERDLRNVMDMATKGAVAELQRSHPDGDLLADGTVSALHRSLTRLGFDPSRLPTCSEQLLSRILNHRAIERGCLAWEFLNVLTVKSHAPWVALDRQQLKPPLVFRIGAPDEILVTPEGDFGCEGLPVLADTEAVKASPWTVNRPDDLVSAKDVVFLCFLPWELFRKVQPKSHLGRVVWLTWAYRFVFERTCPGQTPPA
ncbi:MAG: hypothetical protein ABIF77_21715 [bacterium]